MSIDPNHRRIEVKPAEDSREWLWECGVATAKPHGIWTRWGFGGAWTRRGAVRAARRRFRQIDRQARRREKSLVIDVESDR